jgi:hypothetical protein
MGLNDEEEVETCEISLEPNDWSYKAEGSQHVILAFCGKDPRLVCFTEESNLTSPLV